MAEGTAEAAELEGEPARAMRRPQLGGRPPPALRLTYSEPSLARTCPFTPPPPAFSMLTRSDAALPESHGAGE